MVQVKCYISVKFTKNIPYAISCLVGALTSLPIVAIVGKKYGSAACLLFGSLWLCIVIPLLGVGGIGLPILYPSMFGVGIGLGFTDVGMTSQGILVEKDFHINRMGFFQASMSIGSFIGVLIGGIFSTFGVSPFFEFLCVSLMSFPISILCYFHLYGVNDEAVISELYGNVETPSCTKKVESHHPTNLQLITHLEAGPLPSSQMNAETTFISGDPMDSVMVSEADSVAVVPEDDHHYMAYLCIIGFCAQIGEGTISDWSTMYFADDLNASPIVTITGYAAFSLMMALGRVMGDKLGMEYGRMVLLKFSGTLSTMGLGIAVLAPSLESAGPVYWAVFGFTLAGEILFPVSTSVNNVYVYMYSIYENASIIILRCRFVAMHAHCILICW